MTQGEGGTEAASADDRRNSSRAGRLLSGKIVYNNSSCVMNCVILNMSDGGAKLRPADIVHCPLEFALRVAGQRPRDCEVVWRSQDTLGVRFR